MGLDIAECDQAARTYLGPFPPAAQTRQIKFPEHSLKTTQLLIKIWNLFFSTSISYWNVDTDSGVDSGLQMEKSKSNSE